MNHIEKMKNDLIELFLNEDTWISFGEGLIKIIAIIIASGLIIRIGTFAISNLFKVRTHSALRISERREATLLKLLVNILTYVVYFIAFLMILESVGIKVGALLAGAGIVGLAVGFGAQSLVKDIITGFFIIFEDQFSVGDFVRIDQFEGIVDEIGLRTTKLQSWTGEIHILPNGSIVQVTNFSLHNSKAVVDISISYESDINRVESILQEFLEKLPEKYEDMVETPQLMGVQNLGPSEVVIRVVAETLPMKHLPIARMLRKEIKNILDKNGIEIPYPRLVMYSRQNEEAMKQKGTMAE
ncbi:mechanosensitive ion channel family protein [Bacillus sp. 03113]|uniref:mechanosensitive ion channel family protein n=1 Tax=Bacillus sp. 03113 TaxID=2578211 RepID=UPI0011450254|nr:mechanosensitive ion channel family protein [Bacillus sp. 03113]